MVVWNIGESHEDIPVIYNYNYNYITFSVFPVGKNSPWGWEYIMTLLSGSGFSYSATESYYSSQQMSSIVSAAAASLAAQGIHTKAYHKGPI